MPQKRRVVWVERDGDLIWVHLSEPGFDTNDKWWESCPNDPVQFPFSKRSFAHITGCALPLFDDYDDPYPLFEIDLESKRILNVWASR